MSRTQWILSGTLAVQAILLAIAAPWSSRSAAQASRVLLPELASFTPSRLEIHENDERSVVLGREGDRWVVEDSDGFPADAAKVDKLLDSLGEITVRRPVVSSNRYHGALKVTEDDHERRLKIWETPDGEPKLELLVGTSPNYRVSHVRLGGEDEVYEARGISPYDLGSEGRAWIDTHFVSVPFDDVTRVKLTNEHGTIELARDQGPWTVVSPAASAGKELDQAAVDSFVRSLTSLSLTDPAGPVSKPDYGLQNPAATVEITYRSGGDSSAAPLNLEAEPGAAAPAAPAVEGTVEVLTLELGGALGDDTGKRYASRSGFDHAVVLSKYDADKLVTEKLADLYKK
jgi:hypothetical protein